MDNVVEIYSDATPETILDDAKNAGLDMVVVCGVHPDGRLYLDTSDDDMAQMLLLLKRAENRIYKLVDEIVEGG